MSGGKKKSGFQITSVTTDYSQASVESQKSSFPSDSSGPPLQAQQPPVGKALTNGGQNMAHSPSLTSRQPGHAQSGSLGRVGIEGGAGTGESRAPSSGPATFSSGAITTAGLVGVGEGRSEGRLPNGPALLDAARAVHHHASSSQPGTPVTTRKQVSTDHVGAHSSRFRVVRLGQGLGEPYRRGRWTCVDFLEREGGEERGLRRVMDSMRHAHSLESLETVGLGGVEVGGGAALLKPLGHIRALKAGHLVHSQGTTHVLAPHVGVDVGAPCKPFSEGQGEADAQKGGPASKPRTFSSGPPSPSHKDHHNLRLGDSPTFDPSLPYILRAAPYHPQQDSRLLLPLRHPSESVRPCHIPSPLRLDMDMAGKSLLRETRSQPSSPSPLLPRDGGFHHIATPIQTPSALSLAQSMFGVGGAFDLNDERSPKNAPRVPSASSTPPGHRLTNTSPHSSPPLSRSSSAPSSPTLRRTACLSISPSSTRIPPVVLRSSHPNLHLAAHKTPPGLHRTPPTPSSWPRHPTTPPAFPRQLKVPGGAERPREEGPSSGQAWVRARGSWPSSHVELCGCGRSRCAEVTERSPCASSSCDRAGQPSSREPPPNPHTPGGPSVSHTQAAFGTATRGVSGERETSSANSNRLKTHPLPSPTPHTGPTELAMPRKQNHIHSPTLTKGCVASNPIQATVDPGLCPVLRPQPCATHSPDLNIKKDPSTFTLIKPGISHPPFLDPSENQSRDFTTAILETDRAASFGPNTVQLQGLSDCPSLRAQGFYCNYSPVDTCDRQTQTQSYEQFDLILCQTESVGHSQVVTEVQTVNAISNVAQLIPSVAQNPVQISAPCRIQTPGPNFSGTDSTVDTRLNFESLASSAFLRHDRNYSGDTLQTQDHNGNKVSLPSNVGDLGFLNCTVGSPGTLVLHDPDISQSPSVTCTHLTANPVASVTAAAVQVSATTASRAAIQGPVHTNAPGAAIQGPAHTTASRATVQGPVHTTAPGAAVQGPVHTTASRATVQGPIHTTATGATVQGPVHTNAPGAAVQGPVHTTASRATVQGPVHTTAPGATVQGPVHTNAPGAAVQGPVHTTASRATVQGPVHTNAPGAAIQGPVHTTASRATVQGPVHTLAPGDAVHGPVHTNAPRAAVQGSVYTNASRAAVQGSVHTTAAVQEDIRAVKIPAHLSTSEPSPQGAETTVNRSRVKPHVEGNEPKEPKPVPLSLTRNSDKAFLSLLLFIHSGSSNNMIAIDNKIEQAMDLVKTHLMMAVREEVEVLREQIKELAERNAQLERENYILRALRERD